MNTSTATAYWLVLLAKREVTKMNLRRSAFVIFRVDGTSVAINYSLATSNCICASGGTQQCL